MWRDWFDSKEQFLPEDWKFMLEGADSLSLRLRLFLAVSTVDKEMPVENSTIERVKKLSNIDARVPRGWTLSIAQFLNKPEIDEEILRTVNFSGRYAVDNYLEWLDGRRMQRSSDELLDRTAGRLFGIDNGGRADAYQTILEFLEPSSEKPVLVVHQEAMQDGMTALAASLCRHLASHRDERELTFVYLPLRPHGPPGAEERVTMPKLIAWLKAFYERRSLGSVTVASDLHQLRADIGTIRRLMTERPVIIILDGHRSPGQRLPYLHAAMIDDPLLPLLEELIHPRHAADLPPPDPEIVGRSRILVLSDQDIHHHAAFRHESVAFPLPADNTLDQLLAELRPAIPAALREPLKQANSCCSDVGLHLFSRMSERMPPHRLPTGIEGLYDAYLEWLEADDSAALSALYLIALTYDGLRSPTLRRLLSQIAACHAHDALKVPWMDLGDAGLAAALSRLQEDKVIQPVMETVHEARTGRDGGATVVLDVVVSGLRQSIVGWLARRDMDSLLLAHRLIAEEALGQHTDQLAVADWLGQYNLRSRRRLYQFFYHAFLSLERGPEGEISRLAAVRHVLPTANEEAYRRLYAVFFRTLTEGPGTLELSRVLGRDGLKSDLLTMALRAGSRHFATDVLDRSTSWKVEGLGLFATTYDWSRLTSPETVRTMVTDMRWNRARAEFSLRRHASLPQSEMADSDVGDRIKLRLDLAIEEAHQSPQYRTVIERARNTLVAAGFTVAQQAEIDHLVPSLARPSDFMATVDQMVHRWTSGCPDTGRMALWAVLLCRKGEARQLNAGVSEYSTQALPRLKEAFVNLFLAERLRRSIFDANPLGRDYIISGRSTRVYIRICLQILQAERILLRTRRQEEETGQGEGEENPDASIADFLIGQVDRHIGIATRYFARFPSESAATLVIRAQRERIVGHGDRSNLDEARRWLGLADEMMWYARDRQTVRMMFLMERCAVYRSLARITAGEERARFYASAVADATHLQWMSSQLAHGIWTNASRRTRNRMKKLSKDLLIQRGSKVNSGHVSSATKLS